MSTIRPFEKPLGMRDTLPTIFEKKESIRQIGREFLLGRGFEFIKTPTLEYYETVGKSSAIKESNLFKLVDSQGNTLVLRPDMTTPIARIATTKLLNEKIPLRLAYFSNVFRAQELEGGRPAEYEQMGIEIIGDDSVYADCEAILTTIEFMKTLEIATFKITIGHAGILDAIIRKNVDDEQQYSVLHQLLVDKNYVGFEEAVHSFNLAPEQATILFAFLQEATELTNIRQISKFLYDKDMFIYMEQLASVLEIANALDYIDFDFTLASHMNYYTGMLFEVFAENTGYPVGNGGRYDGLLQEFGYAASAIGFALRIDQLLEAMPKKQLTVDTVLVLYVATQFEKALKTTASLRRQGRRTTMQAIEGIDDIARFEKNFSAVVRIAQGGIDNDY
ncbi:ATP phosphoribosyltransferase regulatory subunit [Kurthia sibirica]|uniref:ATP phosphoribosyltransferase regulatory subunit n=1 Tax=Kurthia sibirica TaxID=202750 RepID=A0A2U3AJA9_9BACL|nr:ATP phosphoribosyltransferase regulatory subunit [Kurthia sibirica]PWI24625.1 ATP phosphoribosyltransferase regulatory subunit [Kurthia sibirica]GEK33453.1 ATP phosphoribosyltransferase regulatory subunit [Kurthia sibirica]